MGFFFVDHDDVPLALPASMHEPNVQEDAFTANATALAVNPDGTNYLDQAGWTTDYPNTYVTNSLRVSKILTLPLERYSTIYVIDDALYGLRAA
jgi:hypothetical protein